MASISRLAKALVIREESAVTIKALEDSEVILIVTAA